VTPPKGEQDVVVIGGGPAGLSAGLVLGRCLRRTLICDDGRYRNARSQALHCFLGQDGVVPLDLLRRSREQVLRYDTVCLTDRTARSVTRAGGTFIVQFNDGSACTAKALLLATGMVDEPPQLRGIEPLFGRSVHVCPYCDGWEHRNAPIAVYGRGEKGAMFAILLRQWSKDLVLCTGGEPLDPQFATQLRAHGISVREEPIDSLDGNGGCLTAIRFRGGEGLPRRALFFTTGQHPRSPLLESLGCARDPKGGLSCDPDGRTSIPGVFVAGDVSRDVQLAIIAAAEGARAALAINKYLLEQAARGTEALAMPFREYGKRS
jgi:thioredoxin reductase